MEVMNETIKEIDSLKWEDFERYPFLFHGTCNEKTHEGENTCDFHKVDNIDLNRSKKHLDFGKGFYLTEDKEQAFKRAKQICSRKQPRSDKLKNKVEEKGLPIKKRVDINNLVPVVIAYPFSSESLDESYKIKVFPTPNNEWLEFVFNNRKENLEISSTTNHNRDYKFEMVYGYIADGLFKEVAKLFKKEHDDVSEEELILLYKTFTARVAKNKKETQISLHTSEIISILLKDGNILEKG